MLNAKTGWSKNASARTAGKEAAVQASGAFVGKATTGRVAFVFGSVDYDQNELLAGLKEGLGATPLIGCTSFTGILTPEGFIGGDKGFVGVLALDDPEMTVGTASFERGECPVETGRKAAEQAMKKASRTDAPDWFYMAVPPGEEEFFLSGIQQITGRVPFIGGSAADNDLSGRWQVYGDGDRAMPNGVAVAFFWNKSFGNCYTGAYRGTGKRGIVTKVDNNRTLREIDGKPALEVVARWLEKTPAELQGADLLFATITHPLGQQDIGNNHVWIRHPMAGNPDMSLQVGNNLCEGTTVEMMEATVDALIGSVGQAARCSLKRLGREPGALLAVHCGGRRGGIGDRIDAVVEEMNNAVGSLPWMGVFTFGEHGFEQVTANGCGGLMLSFMALGK